MKLNVLTLFFGVAVLIVYIVMYPYGAWTPMRITGACIGLCGLLLLGVARLQLGSAFSVQAKAHHLVTTGLYARIRNPIYVFGAVAMVGIMLYVGRPLFLLVFLVIIPMQVYRSRKEEAVLAEKFGEEYQRYKAQTWF